MLDVGCGRQPFRGLIESLGFTYQSCDVNQSPENTVDYVFAIDAPVPPALTDAAPFELLFCTEVLEHVADWDAAFGHMSGLLAQGGLLIITAPHFYQLHEVPYDFWRPTLYAIEYFAKRHGLEIVHSEAAGDGWDVLGTVLANMTVGAKTMRIYDRIIARIARAAKSTLSALLVKRSIQKLLGVGGPLYISNIAVYRKGVPL
jgi:SAM-dependent methyltransferase